MPQVNEISWLYSSLFLIFIFLLFFITLNYYSSFSKNFSLQTNIKFFPCFLN